VRYGTKITEIIFIYRLTFFVVRMYRTAFELIRKKASRERQFDNIGDNGK